MHTYDKDPASIYAKSFATVRAEADLTRFAPDLHAPIVRMIHACGTVDLVADIAASPDVIVHVQNALAQKRPVLCDCEMVRSGIIQRLIPDIDVVVTLNDPQTPTLAATHQTTRSAAAVELWRPYLESAVVVIGNAPTALFHLLEIIAAGAPKPAAILGFPVGFVGAAESKQALAASTLPYITVHGRRGGSAIASACFNGITA